MDLRLTPSSCTPCSCILPHTLLDLSFVPLPPGLLELFRPTLYFFFPHSARAANRSTAAAASRAAISAAADARRRVRAATWEANAAAALGRQMGLVNALTDASVGWISRDRLGDAVERLVDETYVEMDEHVLDPPVSLIPAGF